MTTLMVRFQTMWPGWFYLLEFALHVLRIPHWH